LQKQSILLLAVLLSMLMVSHPIHAETRPEISAASRHALVYIAPKGKWIVQMEAHDISFSNTYDHAGNKTAFGSEFSGINLNSKVFSPLAIFGPAASLGTSSLAAQVDVQVAQVTMGYGLTEDITLGIISNFGQSKTSVDFSVAGGNTGWNPLYNPLAPITPANFPFAPVGGGALKAMTATDINSILSNPAFGYGYKPVQSTKVRDLGTVLFGALWRFYKGEYGSLVAGLGVRKSFAGENDPDNLLDIPIDDGSNDVVARIEYYGQIASIFDARLMVKRTFQLSDRVTSRVAAPGQMLALAASKEVLDRNMGDIWEYDVEVGVSYESWRLSATWHRFLKKADHYFSARGQNVASLIQNTAQRTDQWRAGISWSGVDAWLNHEISVPLIIKLEMLDTPGGYNTNAVRDYYLVVTSFF